MPTRTSRTTSPRSAAEPGGERGTGVIGTLAGVTAFLVLLLFAVHLVLNLYATSVVTGVAFDAARIVAGSDGGPDAEAAGEAHVRALLRRYAERGSLELAWRYPSTDGDAEPDVVQLTVTATHPTRLLPAAVLPYQRITRTISVRLETFR